MPSHLFYFLQIVHDRTILSFSGCHVIGSAQGLMIDVKERNGIKCRNMRNCSIFICFACGNPKAVEILMEDHQWSSLQPFLLWVQCSRL